MKILLHTIERVRAFSKIANKIDEDIFLIQGDYKIDAKSLMGTFSLNLTIPILLEAPLLKKEEINNIFSEFAV